MERKEERSDGLKEWRESKTNFETSTMGRSVRKALKVRGHDVVWRQEKRREEKAEKCPWLLRLLQASMEDFEIKKTKRRDALFGKREILRQMFPSST